MAAQLGRLRIRLWIATAALGGAQCPLIAQLAPPRISRSTS
jgi:hypothetical protein